MLVAAEKTLKQISVDLALAGNVQRMRRPAAAGAVRLDRAAGGDDDVLHDREAEAGAARGARRVGAPEALEEARQVGSGDADAVVGGGEHDDVARARGSRA